MRTTHHDRHRCAQNADHLTHNRTFSAFFTEVVCTLGTIPPQTVISPSPNGGNGVIRDPTRRRHAASQFLMLQNPHRRREGTRATGVPPDARPDCGTCGRRARPRCRWAVAGPGRASRRRAERSSRRGRLAGGPPPTDTHSGRALRRPEHPWAHNTTRPRPVSRTRPRHAHAAPLSKAARRRSAPFTTAPPAIRRSCPRDPRPRRGQPRGGRRGRGTGSRTRSPGPQCGRSGSTAGRHRAHHTRRA